MSTQQTPPEASATAPVRESAGDRKSPARIAREKAGIDVATAAKEIRVTPDTFREKEAGRAKFTTRNCKWLSALYGGCNWLVFSATWALCQQRLREKRKREKSKTKQGGTKPNRTAVEDALKRKPRPVSTTGRTERLETKTAPLLTRGRGL